MGVVEMIDWVGKNGIACTVKLGNGCETHIKQDYYYELKSVG